MPCRRKRAKKYLKKQERERGKTRKAEKDKAIKNNDRNHRIPRKQWT
jgi:hypothetical protein